MVPQKVYGIFLRIMSLYANLAREACETHKRDYSFQVQGGRFTSLLDNNKIDAIMIVPLMVGIEHRPIRVQRFDRAPNLFTHMLF
ncbi:MAG: hypothetical protein M1368_01635 [Thaumarchaeota archaeon]|nr:hypothetical protein [Nitrososphaerota archaeon]MDG6994547.1 hypothetical protein [Nitrososphaerota archaeon]